MAQATVHSTAGGTVSSSIATDGGETYVDYTIKVDSEGSIPYLHDSNGDASPTDITATATTGTFLYWMADGVAKNTWDLIRVGQGGVSEIVAVFALPLTAGHNYILSCKDAYAEGSAGIQSITQSGNSLIVYNKSPIDLVDLGQGTDTGDAKVIVNTPEGVWNAKGTRVHVELDDGFYWLDDGAYVQPPPPLIVGVTITESESDCYNRVQYAQTLSTGEGTYDNMAYGATPMSGAGTSFNVGSWGSGDLADFISGIKPVSFDGTTWTDLDTTSETNWPSTQGTDCFTEFPFRWLSITKSNGVITVVFSSAEEAPDSTFQNYAFLGADGETQRPNFHLGCYTASGTVSSKAISGGVYSQKGSSNAVSASLNQYWVGASRRGAEYDCLPFQQWTYLQALFLVLYKSTDSQTAHSKGYTGDYYGQSNSEFASYGNDYGMYGTTEDYTTQMAFFWLHNLWGNRSQAIASVFVRANGNSDKTLYYILSAMSRSSNWDNGSWDSTSNYALMTSLGTSTGSVGGGSGNTKFTKAIGNNTAGFATASDSDTGSASTYYADSGRIGVDSSYALFPCVGGYFLSGSDAGVFFCFAIYYSTFSESYVVSRLSYRGGHNY